jgi:polar amino acid transport system substrate-binding protein
LPSPVKGEGGLPLPDQVGVGLLLDHVFSVHPVRRVIVPQAVRIVVPAVTNDFIALFKDTSVCSVIAVTELTKQYNMLANSTGSILELAAMTAVLYLVMSYPLSVIAARLEAKMSGQQRA